MLGYTGGVVSVYFCQTPDYEETYDKECLGEQGSRLTAPRRDELGADEGADEAPYVQHDVLLSS